jgi:hypothetical protein
LTSPASLPDSRGTAVLFILHCAGSPGRTHDNEEIDPVAAVP